MPAAGIVLILSLIDASGQRSVFSFPFDNPVRLPSMYTVIDRGRIAASYQTLGNIYTTEVTGPEAEMMEQTSTSFISDVKAVDAVRFLEYYINQQLLIPGDPFTEQSGTLEMSVIYFNANRHFNLGTGLGVLTFGIGTLLGIPHATIVTDVEVEAAFYDKDDRLVAVHRGIGKRRGMETLYNNPLRENHQKALKEALEDLNNRIMSDPKLITAATEIPGISERVELSSGQPEPRDTTAAPAAPAQ